MTKDEAPDHSDELTIAYLSGVHRGKELAAAQAVREAVEAEREACAKIADLAEPYQAADLIRARGNT